jgi:hypothetical protein
MAGGLDKISSGCAQGSGATAESVQEWCRADLMGYKVPREVTYRQITPVGGGEVLRRELVRNYTG